VADSTIPNLTAVTTPAGTDEFGVRQSGDTRDKKQTRAQVHALESGEHLVLPAINEPATPTLEFGGGSGLGIVARAASILGFVTDSTNQFRVEGTGLTSETSAGGGIRNETVSATNPTLNANRGDFDTGIGSAAADQLSLIAGGVEAMRFSEATGVIQTVESDVGLTADVGSAQGNGVILSSFNVYSTVGTAGDAATLPATFDVGTTIHVKNDAATNSMDVFPALGDDAGAGANLAVAVAAGAFAVFFATATDTTWTKLMGGTA